MRLCVRAALLPFLAAFEGDVPGMYLDRLGLVTVGIGFKIDSPGAAMRLRWTWKATGEPASASAIQGEWTRVKGLRAFAGKGGGWFQTNPNGGARLEVDPASLAEAVAAWLSSGETYLRHDWPGYDAAPADAQLALLRMAWAFGPAFLNGPHPWPKLLAALCAGDFLTAAQESWPGDADQQPAAYRESFLDVATLFRNASATPDPDVLQWPANLVPLSGAA